MIDHTASLESDLTLSAFNFSMCWFWNDLNQLYSRLFSVIDNDLFLGRCIVLLGALGRWLSGLLALCSKSSSFSLFLASAFIFFSLLHDLFVL